MDKAQARRAGFDARRVAHLPASGARGAAILQDFLTPYRGLTVAGYMAMRTEIDPLPAMMEMAKYGTICVPVIVDAAQPLAFHRWTPRCDMTKGAFGAMIPVAGEIVVPQIVVVPMVAYDLAGQRLGYGGGFYDRTLEQLRAHNTVRAIGFAYAGQQMDGLPTEPTDQPLDAIVTENGVVTF
jgi:5-formyltetrahydrofolate cyclo-ligase